MHNFFLLVLLNLDSLKVEISYSVSLFDIPENSELNLWIPLPLESSEQKILKEEIKSELPYSINLEKRYKNRVLFLRSNKKRELNIELKFLILRYESKEIKNEFSDLSIFLKPDRLIPINDSTIKIAKNIINGKKVDNFEIAKILYNYTLFYMTYDKSGEGWGRGDFWYACKYKKGNCTDFHSFFIGLARSLKIPSFFEIGFSIPREKKEGKINGYHCWAYFYNKGKWFPVDISEADKNNELKDYYFGRLDPYRISFTRGRDIVLEPPQKGEPLNYFIYPYVEINGKNFNNIKYEFRYKILN